MPPTQPAKFTETQSLSPRLGGVILASILVIAAVSIYFAPPGSRLVALPWLLLPVALVSALFLTARMHTRVQDGAVHIRTLFVVRRSFLLSKVTEASVCTYYPIREFGGWGIRRSRYRRAYNMRGDRGVELKFGRDKPVVIGSQVPEDLLAAIDAEKRKG